MKVAVEGCCHGELDKIYDTLAFIESRDNIKVDLLLICGDFQAVRNECDLKAMAVPAKYQTMNSFYKYYSGEKKAPVLTIFIGGNHEASNYLQELPYGGWVAPNIYYLGYAGVVRYGGLRIAGLSGIYKPRDYTRGHYEHPPYSEDTKRSCYHIRNIDVFRLKQLRQPIDIFLSHDWPRGIYRYGNVDELLRYKKYFAEEVASGTLGSAPTEELLHELQPDYWFSAHLHVKFAALVNHERPDGSTKVTKFLSLDKCLPKRQFLQILDIESNESSHQLELDREWLCVLRSTNHLLRLTNSTCYMPGPSAAHTERYDFSATQAELCAIDADFAGLFTVPNNFTATVAAFKPHNDLRGMTKVPQMNINPQTSLLCDMLGLTDPFSVFTGHTGGTLGVDSMVGVVQSVAVGDDDSLDVDDHDDEGILDDSDTIDTTLDSTTSSFVTAANVTFNPDEISLDEDSSSEGSGGGEEQDIEETAGDTADTDSHQPAAKRPSLSPTQLMAVHAADSPHTAAAAAQASDRPHAVETVNSDGIKACNRLEDLEADNSDSVKAGDRSEAVDEGGSDIVVKACDRLAKAVAKVSSSSDHSAEASVTALESSPRRPAVVYSQMRRRNLAIYAQTADSSSSDND